MKYILDFPPFCGYSCNVANFAVDSKSLKPSPLSARTIEEPEWVDNPPETVEEKVLHVEANLDRLTEKTKVGEVLRGFFAEAKRYHQEALRAAKTAYPIAFFKPSYEQALLLNAWVWGITFPICFSANRIGKTIAFVINALLWIFPNNPQWLLFKPYLDFKGRIVAVLPRPRLSRLLDLQHFYEDNPHLVGDPRKQPYEEPNIKKWSFVKSVATLQLHDAYPEPPIQHGAVFWLGAPDNDWHRDTVMPFWRRWLPKDSILRDNSVDRFFILQVNRKDAPALAHRIICKSYESEETKWSGEAVQGIILTEGFSQSTLDEIKQRIVNDGFMSWDYTPAEARNVGKKAALAHKVLKREEELPLRQYVYTKFSVRDAPEHILPKEKKADLIRMWEGKEQGKARLDGDFYASSGLVLSKLDYDFHCLKWTLQELLQRFPDGRFYRSIDPGRDHPTACAWGYLIYSNIWFIYRFYSKRGTTISERCQDIIRLSNNVRRKFVRRGQVYWQEYHPYPTSEVYNLTVADYHVFKDDENTGQNYALNYSNEGIVLTESTHMGPEDRAKMVDNMLDPQAFPYLAHPLKETPPGAKIFFLINETGVAPALNKMSELFWDRYLAGDHKGEPKDKVPIHGDDELDALCQLGCGPFAWNQWQPKRIEPRDSEPELILPNVPKPRRFRQTAGYFG